MVSAALFALSLLCAVQNPPGFPPPAPGVPQSPTHAPDANAPRPPRVKTIKLATGESKPFVFRGRSPESVQSETLAFRRGGPELTRDGGVPRMGWAFEIDGRRAGSVGPLKKVVVDEVSGSEVRPIFSGMPDVDKEIVGIYVTADPVSKEKYPWLYEGRPTTFVFRFRFEREGQDAETLYQPIVVAPDVKQDLKQMGYLP